jgi:hypothetical protein
VGKHWNAANLDRLMTFSLEKAIVYDIEILPNVFTLHMEGLFSDVFSTWEISQYRDDRKELFQWFDYLYRNKIPMIGFNTINYDYPMIHYLFNNPQITNADLYAKSQQIIGGNDKFGNIIWDRDRFAPQIDLFKIYHMDNKAKTTSLKALQFNMRCDDIVEGKLPWDQPASEHDINTDLIPYNKSDVAKTKQFALHSLDAINFRIGLISDFGIDVLNYNDTKIGEKMLVKRLGEDLCYERTPRWDGDNYGRKKTRQTIRHRIALNDIIFPYVSFEDPEFNRVLSYLRGQVLTPAEIDDIGKEDVSIRTKGVFTGLKAHVGGIEFKFGTGGIHASVNAQRIVATDEWLIRDIDVASLYPNIAIKNRLAPEHLGEAFVQEYAKLPAERKEWQAKKGKKCIEANSLKLASNGTYGKTNDKFSPFFDPQYTMAVTINGQFLLCMLAEWLLKVPTLSIIQANTDGITYYIHRDHLDAAKAVEKRWQEFTLLTLEDVSYSRMFIRDVNNYVAEGTDGKLKLKGAYEFPDPMNYAESISTMQPPGWHKDWSNVISTRAAVLSMVHGLDVETIIRGHSDPFDFMLRARATGGAHLVHGGAQVQRTFRYYVAKNGAPLIKMSPAAGPEGMFKRKNGVSEAEYLKVMEANGWQWDGSVCTGNKSRYDKRETSVEAGWNVADCCTASNFRFDNLEYRFYVEAAKKLVI